MARSISSLAVVATALILAPAPAGAAEAEPSPTRWEPSVLPELNYDSNIGFGFGAVGTLTRYEPAFDTFRFRLQAQFFASVAVDAAGNPSLPFHDDFIRGDFPGLLGDRLRLAVELGFGKFADSKYYGIGQLAGRRSFSDAELESSELARRYYTYDRLWPHADVLGFITLVGVERPGRDARLEALVAVGSAYQGITPQPRGKLEQDMADPDLSHLLFGTSSHGIGTFATGVSWDSRDHDFAPSRGTLVELATRMGVFGDGADTSLFARLHASVRWFAPLAGDALVWAHRTALDWIVGDAPFYELSQFGVSQVEEGPGGSGSVRGVLLRRFHGKIKVVENAELRAQGPWLRLHGQRFRVGAVLFFDAGRVWSDVHADPALDGPWAPFAIGLGSGLRVRWGETVILRADFGVSPTDSTSGFSIDLGHVF